MKLDIDPKTQRVAWLEGRRAGLGSSEAPAVVLPIDKRPGYMSPWAVWSSKVNGVDADLEGNLFVEFGNKFERSVGEHIAEAVGKTIVDGGWYQSDDHPWMMASPDFWLTPGMGKVWTPGDEREGVECKVIQNPTTASDWLVNSAPPHVTIQAHWCMMVTGAKRWHIGALLWFSQEFRHYTVEHDPEFQAKLFTKADAWWKRFIVGGEEPDIDSTKDCADAMLFKAQTPDGLIREGNDAETAAVAHLVRAKVAAKAAKIEEDTAKNFLKQLISGNRGLDTSAGRVLWSHCAGKTSFDQKRFKEDHPDLFTEFTKKGDDYRRMTYAKPKAPKKGN